MNWVIKLLDFCRVSFLFPLFLPAYNKSHSQAASVSRASPWLHGWDENSSMLRWLETNLLLQIGILCLHKDTLIIDVSLLPDAFETNSWATLSKTISGEPLLTDQRRAEWLFVLEAFPLQSAWLLAGWYSGFSYRPASWRSCIQFVSRLRVEIALINALTVILTQGFFSLGFVLTVVGNAL